MTDAPSPCEGPLILSGQHISLPRPAIERTSPVPFYFQLSRALKEEIVAGRWPAGQQIASEPALGAHFGVSRTTVRQALARLENEGLLRRVKGRGTFVAAAAPRSWMLHSPDGFFRDESERLGIAVTSVILRQEVAELPDWACDALGLPVGSQGAVLARLRYVDGRVALYTVNHLPVELADTVLGLAPDASLYEQLLERDGRAVHGGRRTVEAVSAGDELGRLLELPAHAALSYIESVSWDQERRPFDCFATWLRTDRTRIEVEITRSSHGAAVDLDRALLREVAGPQDDTHQTRGAADG